MCIFFGFWVDCVGVFVYVFIFLFVFFVVRELIFLVVIGVLYIFFMFFYKWIGYIIFV